MGFSVGKTQGARRVVLDIDLGDGQSARYAVTQLKRSEVIVAQAEDRRQGDKASNAVLVDTIFNKTEPLDDAEDIRDLSDRFEEADYTEFIKYLIRIATSDPATLAGENIETLPPKAEKSETDDNGSRND